MLLGFLIKSEGSRFGTAKIGARRRFNPDKYYSGIICYQNDEGNNGEPLSVALRLNIGLP